MSESTKFTSALYFSCSMNRFFPTSRALWYSIQIKNCLFIPIMRCSVTHTFKCTSRRFFWRNMIFLFPSWDNREIKDGVFMIDNWDYVMWFEDIGMILSSQMVFFVKYMSRHSADNDVKNSDSRDAVCMYWSSGIQGVVINMNFHWLDYRFWLVIVDQFPKTSVIVVGRSWSKSHMMKTKWLK